MAINVREVVIEKLRQIGADGLCTVDCGCDINDLFPCGYVNELCEAAEKTIATKDSITGGYEKGDEIYVPKQ